MGEKRVNANISAEPAPLPVDLPGQPIQVNDICFLSPLSAETRPPELIENFQPFSPFVIVIGRRFETQRRRPEMASLPSRRAPSGAPEWEDAPLMVVAAAMLLYKSVVEGCQGRARQVRATDECAVSRVPSCRVVSCRVSNSPFPIMSQSAIRMF